MKNSDYWKQRFTQLEEAQNKKVTCIIAINNEIYIEVDNED